MWGSIVFAALAFGGQATPGAVAPQAQAARDERPLLWRGLRAGMSPGEVAAALQAEGIRAESGIDPATHRQYVATRESVREAGRQAEAAFGFVDDRLFYVEVNWGRLVAGRVTFAHSNFMRVASALERRFGQPVSIDPDYRVSNIQRGAYAATAHGRFEQDGVRADLTGNTYASSVPDAPEFVDVRYWRIADAEAFAADRARKVPAAETGGD